MVSSTAADAIIDAIDKGQHVEIGQWGAGTVDSDLYAKQESQS